MRVINEGRDPQSDDGSTSTSLSSATTSPHAGGSLPLAVCRVCVHVWATVGGSLTVRPCMDRGVVTSAVTSPDRAQWRCSI